MAAIVETWLNCELTEPVQVRYLKGVVFTQDSLGNRIGVHVFKNGNPASLTGSVTGYCVLADGETVPVPGTRSGSDVYIDLLQACYAVQGPISIVLKLSDGDSIVTLCCVVATVYVSKTDNMVTPSQTVIDDWAAQIAAMLQECIDATAGTVKYSEAQSLTDAQKAQARQNIGASGGGDIPTDVVKYTPQSLTTAQKTQARTNIGAASSGDIISDPVRYGTAQSLTDAQKTQARQNIGAPSSSDIPTNVVKYTVQTLTDAQKTQARANIGAANADDIISDPVRYGTAQSLSAAQKTQARTNIEANVDIGLYVGDDGYIYQTYTT